MKILKKSILLIKIDYLLTIAAKCYLEREKDKFPGCSAGLNVLRFLEVLPMGPHGPSCSAGWSILRFLEVLHMGTHGPLMSRWALPLAIHPWATQVMLGSVWSVPFQAQ